MRSTMADGGITIPISDSPVFLWFTQANVHPTP